MRNRELHISKTLSEKRKVDIQEKKVDIQKLLGINSNRISQKTINHIIDLYSIYGNIKYFGRSEVEELLGIKASGASKFIKLLLDSKIISSVSGHGKGKYQFNL